MEQLTTSVNATMRALGLGRTTVNAMISDGRLESVKLGGRRLVKVESIRRLIDDKA
ncbi:helix-turn-helix domain-containing protein [Sphingorhabdus sp.]|jgi:excisionase family DNA binding protein|uniref:helix-turn-helix domain-containing protein n=1 Tax=Sphingorhabdus sp. TaxID=1902408 RepID=UPI0037CBB2AE